MAEIGRPENDGQWHLDKRIPLAIVATIAVQTILAGIWVGSLQSQVATMAEWIHDNRNVDSRLAVLESQNTSIQGTLVRIETTLNKAPITSP